MFEHFRVGDLFDIHPTIAYKMKNSDLFAKEGSTPVLSNSSANNGIGGYCGLEPTEQGNIITFSDTTTGADTMFYQAGPFIGYPHVQGMYPYQQDKWGEKSYLYAISCIRRAAGNGWNYAVKFNRTLVADMLIELPVIESADSNHEYTVDDIDWQYMQDRITELEQDRITELDAYLKATGLDDYELTDEDRKILSLSQESTSNEAGALATDCKDGKIEFKDFRIIDIFEVKNTKSVMQNQIQPSSGNTPYLTASDNCNAVGTYISCDDAWIDEGNCIFIGGKTMIVTYQELDFVSNDSHNLALYFKDSSKRTRRIQQFMCSAIDKSLSQKYSWGDSVSRRKIRSDFIKLPVNSHNDIDFDYMERYVRAIEKLTIADVVKYKDKVIETTRAVVSA